MKLIVLVTLFTLVCQVKTSNRVFGNVQDKVILINTTNVQYNAIPFMKRVKYFFYNTPRNEKIAGIQALDTLHSMASINITAGGVGHPFVNLRVKSERGTRLDYNIGIYVEDNRFTY